MSVLNDLIRIKTSRQEDDLVKMLEEIPVYEKLSVNEQFRDLKTSEITRAKCPLLAGFVDEHPYELILGDLIANIYLQIEDYIPHLLMKTVERTPKQQKQFEILQKGIANVEYKELIEYDHETMAEHVTAVFTNRRKGAVIAVIIVRVQNGYEMYHGSYVLDENSRITVKTLSPVMTKGKKGVLVMEIYSMLGNNAHPFARYTNEKESYDVMIGLDGKLYLIKDDGESIEHKISHEEHNRLNMAKKKIEKYAEEVIAIIESVV